jgi:DNA repair exonuclease SbcCD ATPase subunit
MFRTKFAVCVAAAVALFAFGVPGAQAQGKIVCWKDAAGKVVGCGDKVPPEYLGSGTRELDKLGNVRKTGESAEEAARRRAKEKEQSQATEEEKKRQAVQKRQDDTLVNTFTNVKEIDLKRDRELQALNNFITQQNAALKGANERLAEARKRTESYEKEKKPVAPVVKEDVARAEREKTRVESEIAANEKSKAEITVKYAEYRTRFMELKGIEPAPPAAAPATPATKK